VKLRCPNCGALMSLDLVMAHDAAREAVQIALQLPAPIGKLLIQYLGLFRRPDGQPLSLDRTANLLGDLLPMIQAAQIKRDGRDWPAPQEVWAAALREMLDRRDSGGLRLPLKSHGYLLEIIAGKGNRAEAKAEAAKEERRQQRPEGRRDGAQRSDPAKASEFLTGLRAGLKGRRPHGTD
jgi:hypothetical protein